MKIYNSHTNKIENIADGGVIKHSTGSFYIDKIDETKLNELGRYNVSIEDKPNSAYYNYSESKELVGNIYTITYIPSDKLLQDTVDYKLSILAYKATEVEEQGITVAGLDIATDVKSQSKLTTAITFFGRKPGETRKFKAKNGFASADKATVEAIQDALDVHLTAVTTNEEIHYNAINLLGSVAEVEAYDITTGW